MSKREGAVTRNTTETQISLELKLDGTGVAQIHTGIGFFDHMLQQVARHGRLDLTVQAKGDLHIDGHHTVEDVGICFGKALADALGDKTGIDRYASVTLPMDETLTTVALDLSGRSYFKYTLPDMPAKTGDYDGELTLEFFKAVSFNAMCNLHFLVHYGQNSHHIHESLFKGFALCLYRASRIDPTRSGIPSTKGQL